MMQRYRVGCLYVEEPLHPTVGERTRQMTDEAVRVAQSRHAIVGRVSRQNVRACLGLEDGSTKHTMACRLAEHFDEVAPILPEPRKPWKPEDRRMKVFEALGLASVGGLHLHNEYSADRSVCEPDHRRDEPKM